MILRGDITINGKLHSKGAYISPWKIYPFFLIHMLAFGGSGFVMAYFSELPAGFLYVHGGFAILVYLVFYLSIFGRDEVKWMLVNALLGIFGLYGEIALLLSFAGKNISSYPVHVHVIPFMYYVLYTFLLRQIVLEVFADGADERKVERVNYWYLGVSLIVYSFIYLLNKLS